MAAGPDPEIQAVLDDLDDGGVPEMHTLSVPAARELMADLFVVDEERREPVADVSDRSVPGPAGEIPVRVYEPDASGPLPILVYFHGGGWVIGDLDSHAPTCRALANAADCVVVSVGYRLAPEAPFPAPLRDCYAAVDHVAANAASFGGEPDRVAVGGDSAGGNLAAAVALLARDRGGPEIGHQLLIYPVANHAFDTDSYAENAEGYFLTKADMEWYWDHYLPTDLHGKNPYASPLQARSLRDLPPATVFTAGFDPLRDEGVEFADRLAAADVAVTHHHYEGAIHGFFGMLVDPDLPQARAAVDQAAAGIDRHLD